MSSLKNIIYISIILAIPLLSTHADPYSIPLKKAAQFYESGNFDSAIVIYQNCIETGLVNSDLYFNLGNSFYRKGSIGLAMLSYEKALTFSPGDKDIIANITFVKSRLVDAHGVPQKGFLETIVLKIHTLLPLTPQLWVLFTVWSLLVLLACGLLFFIGNARMWLLYGMVILGFMFIPLSISTILKVFQVETVHNAILLYPSIDARNQPNGQTVLFTAHEGTKFLIRQNLENWSLVSLENGVSGWVPDASLGKI